MARARFIRPEFFSDERTGNLPIGARLLLLSIWGQSDLRGVFEHDAEGLRLAAFQFDKDLTNRNIHLWLGNIEEQRLIGRITDRHSYVCNWLEWQRVSPHEICQGSGYPIPPRWEDPDHWLRVREDAIRRGSTSAWRIIRLLIFERDDYICAYCKVFTESPHCDHVLPVSRGGESTMDNLVTACAKCNLTKSDKTPEEWLG